MESYIVRISSKGQLTLPASIRKKLGLGKGDQLFVVLDNDEVRMRMTKGEIPVFTKTSSFFDLMGTFDGPANLAEKHDKYIAGTEK